MPGTLEAAGAQNDELPEKYRGLTIIRPEHGSPYVIDPETGLIAFIPRPGTRPVTTEDVLRELEQFP